MEFRRIAGLPPYVFTIIDGIKLEMQTEGIDVVDLGFGNPDIPSSPVAVEALREAALDPANHRYSKSKGIDEVREGIVALYKRRFDVDLDVDTEVIMTMGVKEGHNHLMLALVQPGDVVFAPTPSYPIHQWGPYLAGATVVPISLGTTGKATEYIDNVIAAYDAAEVKPRVVTASFPHNPTCTIATQNDLQRLVDWAADKDLVVIHDLAYAETAYDGWLPPSILQCEGAKKNCVEFYSLTKSFSMAGWRVGFMMGCPEVVQALTTIKSYMDYGTFAPIQIAAAKVLKDAADFPPQVNQHYQARRDALHAEFSKIGWEFPRPAGTMFAWAPIPPAYREMGSIDFAKKLIRECRVAVSPGVGFGEGGEGYIRFALIDSPERIAQAARQVADGLPELRK